MVSSDSISEDTIVCRMSQTRLVNMFCILTTSDWFSFLLGPPSGVRCDQPGRSGFPEHTFLSFFRGATWRARSSSLAETPFRSSRKLAVCVHRQQFTWCKKGRFLIRFCSAIYCSAFFESAPGDTVSIVSEPGRLCSQTAVYLVQKGSTFIIRFCSAIYCSAFFESDGINASNESAIRHIV